MKNKETIKILKDISQKHNTPVEQRVFDKAIAALEYCEKNKLIYYIEDKKFDKSEI